MYGSDIFAPPRRGRAHEVGGGHWNTLLPFYNYLMNSTDFSISGCI